MKRPTLIFCAFLVVILFVYLAVPRTPKSPSELTNSIKDERWNSSEWISLSSNTFTNLLFDITHTSDLNLSKAQSDNLYAKLQEWSIAYSTNSLDKFLHFRSPDSINLVDSNIGARINWLQTYRNVVTNNMTAKDLLKIAYDFDSKHVFTQVSPIALSVRTKAVSNLDDNFTGHELYKIYNGVYTGLGGNSAFVYINSAENIINSNKELLFCNFTGAFHTSLDSVNATPISLFLYWSPKDRKWIPYRFHFLTRGNTDTELSFCF